MSSASVEQDRRGTMRVRGVLLSLMMALVFGAAGLAGTALAAQDTSCNFEWDAFLSPGLSTSPSSGSLTTNGETGTADCSGPVNGQQPTGQGKAGISGRYGTKGGDTCQSGGHGDGVMSLSIPTSRGTEHITNTLTFAYGGLQGGLFSGTFEGDRMSGTFVARPMEGDCASQPLTRFHVTLQGTLRR